MMWAEAVFRSFSSLTLRVLVTVRSCFDFSLAIRVFFTTVVLYILLITHTLDSIRSAPVNPDRQQQTHDPAPVLTEAVFVSLT